MPFLNTVFGILRDELPGQTQNVARDLLNNLKGLDFPSKLEITQSEELESQHNKLAAILQDNLAANYLVPEFQANIVSGEETTVDFCFTDDATGALSFIKMYCTPNLVTNTISDIHLKTTTHGDIDIKEYSGRVESDSSLAKVLNEIWQKTISPES